MESWQREVFRQHEPPPGGLARLRRRLAEPRPRRRIVPGLAAAFAAAAIVAAVSWSLLRPTADRPRPGGGDPLAVFIDDTGSAPPALVEYGLAAEPDEPVSIAPNRRGQLAVSRVAVARPDVVFYWVSSPDPGGEPPPD